MRAVSKIFQILFIKFVRLGACIFIKRKKSKSYNSVSRVQLRKLISPSLAKIIQLRRRLHGVFQPRSNCNWNECIALSFTFYVLFGNLSLFASYVILMRPKKDETVAYKIQFWQLARSRVSPGVLLNWNDCLWLLAIRLTIFYGSLKG